MRIGHGYDVHRFAENRDLILGGVKIPFHTGLLGHSDADVLLHAVMDALLGAAGLRAIGYHFPDTDMCYKDASSLALLGCVAQKIAEKGYQVSNVDVTVIAQAPKLKCHIPQMQKNIAAQLSVDMDRINVKATTEEGLGFTGNMQGIACHAVCLLEER
jgi:2-C-methyl-D-erythritol 2,4-cyclodiphosphate synthase